MSIAYRYLLLPATTQADELPRRQLLPGDYVLGSAAECDIMVLGQGISRRHCALSILEDGGALVRDLDSTNGTRVDGRQVRQIACAGDFALSLGTVTFELRAVDPLRSTLAVVGAGVPEFKVANDAGGTPPTLTRQVDLNSKLVDTAMSSLPDTAELGVAELQALLVAWSQLLAPCSLAVRNSHAPGWLALAAQEHGDQALEHWAREGHLELHGSPVPAAQRDCVAAAFRQLLRWRPLSQPAAAKATSKQALPPGVAGRSPAMRTLYRELSRVASSRLSVMLLGETGAGKELLASWVHQCSPRREGPFLAINCAALPHDLLEAELFGVEKGAATGVDARAGIFERASGGTLFLDEIGDMPAETQVRVLRTLEDGRIFRVGGRELRQVDVRIVCATHADLAAATSAGSFRSDLYHRLAGYEVHVPPLRERLEDIAPLALHFFHSACQEAGRGCPGVTRGALLALHQWHWPGNVRELRQTMHRAAVLLDPGEALDLHHLPASLSGIQPDALDLSLNGAVARAERDAMIRALAACDGQHEAAWVALGIGKTSFYKRLKLLEADNNSREECLSG